MLKLTAAFLVAAFGTSCMTAYDSYGRPTTTMHPAGVVGTAAAAGLIGYAIGQNNERDGGHRHGRKNYHRNSGYKHGHGHGYYYAKPRPRYYYR